MSASSVASESVPRLAAWGGFTSRLSVLYIAGIAIAIGLASLHPQVASGVLVLLAICALIGPCAAVMCLSLAVVVGGLNGSLVVLTAQAQGLRWLVVLAACLRLVPAIRLRSLPLLLPLFAFSSIAAITSVISSPYPGLSLMKVATFTFVVASLVGGIYSLRADQSWRLQTWLFSLAFAVLLLSLLTLVNPAVAFRTNGRGFQGVLTHPQAFGALMLPFAAWLSAQVLFSRLGRSVWDVGILLVLLAATVASGARVAVGALFVSTALTSSLVYVRRRFVGVRRPAVVTALLAFLLASVVGVSLLASNTLADAAANFLRKGLAGASVVESLDASRGEFVRSQWARFLRRPLTGHGFGVPATGEPLQVNKVMGIPISASVEKGVALSAVLEEVGILGFAAALSFVLLLTKQVVRVRDFRWHALFFACLLVNFGEAVFFSMGGPGLFFWPLICIALNPALAQPDRSPAA